MKKNDIMSKRVVLLKNKAHVLIGLTIIGLIFIALCSPDFMLRISVFMISPESALNMRYKMYESEENGQLYKITKNPPIEKNTGGILTTWKVYHIGPLCFAKYHGEG